MPEALISSERSRVGPDGAAFRALEDRYNRGPNRLARCKLIAAEELARHATIAGRHAEAHGHRAAVARERRWLRMRELRAQNHLVRVRRLKRERCVAARRRGNVSLVLASKRRLGCAGRPRARARRTARPTRAGPSDGPGKQGDEAPPAGRREVRPLTAPGRSRWRAALASVVGGAA